MSPVRTTTRSFRRKLSRVFSSRLVFPEPGELMKLRVRIPCSTNRARSPAAMRSFSLRTFFSSGTRSIFFHLQIGKFQFSAAETFAAQTSAVGTLEIVVLHAKLGATIQDRKSTRTKLDVQV